MVMLRFATLLASAAAILLSTAELVHAEIKGCPYSYSVCGWDLIKSGTTEQDLIAILQSYKQPTDPSHIYDSLYVCFKQGQVGWDKWCGGPYKCGTMKFPPFGTCL
ncbi:hypothetical protein B0H65DRAFT_480915 [Neurospora tetraspora]|uniref:Uncharacterized protein n=1 Tax=Neurospora tetraspora TaxID=94610 RepID=A0AAE0J0N9_9PEZI|nr:hypothetical protein B0H65DRAFT_480915 [Neurospora tetraspora]